MEGAGIYRITNEMNGKCYVGSALNPCRRQQGHLSTLKRGDHHNRHLQAAWNLYGGENFTFAVLESVSDPGSLIEREQYYLDLLSPEYNLSPTAGSALGVKHTDETRQRMGEAMKTLYADPEYRQRQSETGLSLHSR